MKLKFWLWILLVLAQSVTWAQSTQLKPVRQDCVLDCGRYDALVFVHGIYGAEETFVNAKTGFNWPREIPQEIAGRPVDIYLLNYQTKLLSWAKDDNPNFDILAEDVLYTMGEIRRKRYRSIGFIAHSLGGNVVSTYLHTVKTRYGHANRAAHAYAINIATPALGSHIANIAIQLKSILGMSDGLLRSLQKDDLYQRMLLTLTEMEAVKGKERGCRLVDLYLAYEKKALVALKVVEEASVARLKAEEEAEAQKALARLMQGYRESKAQCQRFADGTDKPPAAGYGQPTWQSQCAALSEPTLSYAASYWNWVRSQRQSHNFGLTFVSTTVEPVGFEEDHSSIVKPTGRDHLVYKWVDGILAQEFARLAKFEIRYDTQLCSNESFRVEGLGEIFPPISPLSFPPVPTPLNRPGF